LPDCKFIPILVLTTEAGTDLSKRQGRRRHGWSQAVQSEVLLDTLKKVLD